VDGRNLLRVSRHLPRLWRFRVLRAIHANGSNDNRRLLAAWARAEGGAAWNNPLNTEEPWPRSWLYNPDGVRDYATAADGIAATAATLTNGHYNGIVRDLRAGTKPAAQIVRDNAAEFDTWGTGSRRVLACL
jgi:hypothetical protein